MSAIPKCLSALALGALVAAASPTDAEAGGRDVDFEDGNLRVTTPNNWQTTENTPYGEVLLIMVTRSPSGRMMLSAQAIDDDLDSAGFAEATRDALEELDFETTSPQLHPATGAYWIDVTAPDAYLRQAFIAAGGRGYALTLAAETPDARAEHIRAFDNVLRSVRLDHDARSSE